MNAKPISIKWVSFLICAALFLLLSACADYNYNRPRTTTFIYYPTDSGSLNAHTKISEAAVASSDAFIQLAEIEKATHPRSKLGPPPDPDCIGLGALASVDWTGPIEPLVRRLAAAGHYIYRVIGKRPAIPVIVAVYATNMPLADILRDANFQAASQADVVIYPGPRIIELRYHKYKT